MLRWLPSDEGLITLDIEAAHAGEAARLARLAPVHPGPLARLADAIRTRVEDRHASTEYPCRLPDGRIGTTAIRHVGGEWIAVCVLRPGLASDPRSARLRPEGTWATRGT